MQIVSVVTNIWTIEAERSLVGARNCCKPTAARASPIFNHIYREERHAKQVRGSVSELRAVAKLQDPERARRKE